MKTENEQAVNLWTQDAPRGYVYKCPECGSQASLGCNAGYHVSQTGHPAPDVVPLVAYPVRLSGRWRHANGYLFCGTLRIAKADFDTDPSDEFKAEVFDDICRLLNQH